jgi:hypothetical protein
VFFIKFKIMKSKKVISLFLGSLIVLFSLNVGVATAAEFRFAKEGQNININEGETVENLYTAGNIISINGEVKKDLYTAGNVITLESDVENNFAGVGGNITISGNVGNNVHIAGGTVIVQGEVAGDLFVAGGNVLLTNTATVGGDLVVGGGTVDIEGQVAGNVYVGGGKVSINSKIGGETKIMADSLKIGGSAEIAKGLKYTSPEKAEISEDAKILGKIDFNQRDTSKSRESSVAGGAFGVLVTLLVLNIATCIIVGFVLVYFFNRFLKNVTGEGLNNVWRSMGVGFAVVFLVPFLVVFFAISIIGLYLAGLLLLLYILLLTISFIIASIILGSLVLKVLKKKEEYEIGWQEVVVGVILMKIISFIPFVGWLFWAVFVLIAIGAVSKLVHGSVMKNK